MFENLIVKYLLFENKNSKNNFIQIDNSYKLKVIKNISQIENSNLENNDYNHLKEGLSLNAHAICIFYNNLLAHVTWIALDVISQKFVDILHTKVDWKNYAVWGRSFTKNEYRNKNLYSFAQQELQNYLLEIGIYKQYFSIKARNYPSINAMKKFNPIVIKIIYKVRLPIINRFTFIFKSKSTGIY